MRTGSLPTCSGWTCWTLLSTLVYMNRTYIYEKFAPSRTIRLLTSQLIGLNAYGVGVKYVSTHPWTNRRILRICNNSLYCCLSEPQRWYTHIYDECWFRLALNQHIYSIVVHRIMCVVWSTADDGVTGISPTHIECRLNRPFVYSHRIKSSTQKNTIAKSHTRAVWDARCKVAYSLHA